MVLVLLTYTAADNIRTTTAVPRLSWAMKPEGDLLAPADRESPGKKRVFVLIMYAFHQLARCTQLVSVTINTDQRTSVSF